MPVINLLHLAGITEITRTRQRITRARTRAPAVPPPNVSEGTTRHYLRYARWFLAAVMPGRRAARSRGCPGRMSPDTCWNGPRPGAAGTDQGLS
jgi:hypothetical protein